MSQSTSPRDRAEAGDAPAERPGRVILVGAGPGDPDLITVRGAAALARADVVLYDELATSELLSLAPPHALRVNVGKRGHDEPTRSQQEINALLVEHAKTGKTVVRLKGGDPFVFGRGGEEASAAVEAGISFEVVPGVTSALAALAYAGIPVTDRRHAASFAVVTGHKDPTRVSEETRWRELGLAVDTLVILMGMRNLPGLVEQIIAGGRDPQTPSAAVMHGSLASQRVVEAPLVDLPKSVAEAGLAAPAVVVVGDVVSLRERLAWWERVPLFGRRVLVTRAPHQAGELAREIRAVGAEPVMRPMIELLVQDDAHECAAIDTTLGKLAEFDALVFSSSNAVHFFSRALEARGLSPATFEGQVLCVGQKTAEVALAAGLPVHRVASGRSDAEGLLREFVQHLSPDGLSVLIPRSDIGRSVIADGLRRAGAHVESIAFYVNRRPEIDGDALRSELCRGELPVLTFTSPSTVDHFVELLDGASRAAAEKAVIAAVGRTTARALEAHGLTPDVVPARPDVRSLVDAIVEHITREPSVGP